MKRLSVVRRVLCSFIAAAMIASVSGCSMSGNRGKGGGLNSARVITNYFKSSDFELSTPFEYVQSMRNIDGNVFLSGMASSANAENVMGIYNTETKTFTEIDLSFADIAYLMDSNLTKDTIFFTYIDRSYSTHIAVLDRASGALKNEITLEADTYVSGTFADKNGDFCLISVKYTAASSTSVLNTYDQNTFELKDTVDLNKQLGIADDKAIAKVVASDDGTFTAIAVSNNEEEKIDLYRLADDMSVINVVEDAMADMQGYISNAYVKQNGDFGLLTEYYDDETGEGKYFLNEIDMLTGTVNNRYEPELSSGSEIYPFVSVNGFDIIFNNNGVIAGFNPEDNSVTDIFDLQNEAGEKFENSYYVSSDGTSLLLLNTYYGGGGSDLTYRYNISSGDISQITAPSSEYGSVLSGVIGDDYYYFVREFQGDKEKYEMHVTDSSGNVSRKIGISTDGLGEEIYPMQYMTGENGIRIAFENFDSAAEKETYWIVKYDLDGNMISKVSSEDMRYIYSIFSIGSEDYLGYSGSSGIVLARINDGNGTVDTVREFPENALGISKGDDKYDVYYHTSEGVYGYSIAEDKEYEIINWIDSDLRIDVRSLSVVNENKIIVSCFDMDTYQNMLYVLDRVDDETLKIIQEKKIITAAGIGISGGTFRDKVIDFNKSSDKYRIQINDYEKYTVYGNEEDGTEYTSGASKLNTDMAAGDIPDIIVGDSDLDLDTYAVKGILTDMNTFVEKDADISRSDYFENIFDLYSTDGKLRQIVINFNIAGLTGEESKLGGGTDWTYDEFFSLADNNQMFYMAGRDELVKQLITQNLSEYIDYSKKTCNFDNDNFRKMIELIKKEGMTQEALDEFYTNNKMDDQWYIDYQNRFKDNKCITEYINLGSFSDIARFQQSTVKGNAALKGMPSDTQSGIIINAGGTIGISEKSKSKEGAWEFAKSFILEDYQDSLNENYAFTFPVLKSSMNKLLENAMKNGEGDFITDSGEYQNANPVDRETGERLIGLIGSSSRKVTTDESICKIIEEELEMFFSDAASAQEVSSDIQNKVSIYLKEAR